MNYTSASMHACTHFDFFDFHCNSPTAPFFPLISSYIQMKFFSASTLGLALALLACTACAASEPTMDMDPSEPTMDMDPSEPTMDMDPATLEDKLVDAFEALGAEIESSVSFLPEVDSKSIIAAESLTLDTLEDAVEGTPNEDAKAIFSWVATKTYIVWKLSLHDIKDFTGAHLHLGPVPGPIVQHLVPDLAEGDFIDPINIPRAKFYVGSFDISEFGEALEVTSIREFVTDYISENEIYINIHGPETVPILRGFLSA